MNWRMMTGGGALGGIGFTMSLFVAGLAFTDPDHLTASKVGILVGSTASAVLGVVLLSAAGRTAAPEPESAPHRSPAARPGS